MRSMTKRAKLYATYQEFLLGLQRVLHRPKEVKITVIEIVGEKRKRNLAFPTCTGVTIVKKGLRSRAWRQHSEVRTSTRWACVPLYYLKYRSIIHLHQTSEHKYEFCHTLRKHTFLLFFYKNTNLSSVKRTRCSCVFHSILYLFYPCQIVMRSMISTG